MHHLVRLQAVEDGRALAAHQDAAVSAVAVEDVVAVLIAHELLRVLR